MYCKSCGAECENGAVFCGNCGAKIETEIETPTVDVGNDNVGNDYPETPPTPPVPPAPPAQTKNNAALIFTILAVLAVVLVAVLIFVTKANGSVNRNRPQDEVGEEQEWNVEDIDEEKQSYYYTYTSDATWHEANQDAKNMGGTLVCIDDWSEFDDVCALADSNNIKVFWVGARKSSSDDWEDASWSNGKKITYTRWFSGEPTYYSEDGESENYLMVFKVNGEWYYNDAIADVSQYYSGKMGYIVEVKE